jgi:hydrogenase small subunit
MTEKTIYESMAERGVSRRDFLKLATLVTAALGLEYARFPEIVHAMETKPRLPVIWLEFQDCAGCTESLTRSHDPYLTKLLFNDISVDYHETLFAAAGVQAEENKEKIMDEYEGQFVLVVEGSIPTKDNGVYCTIGGRSALDLLEEAAAKAMAVVAVGTCSSFGGLPHASPNPTGAVGVHELVTDKPLINIPGCPPIPEVITNTIAHVVLLGIPELDALGRPKAFYGQTVHDRCPRRPFYERGQFAESYDDDGAKAGWCLYKLGCKGPTTYSACATIKWNEGVSFPVQANHPCLGCTEPDFWDGGGFYKSLAAPPGAEETSWAEKGMAFAGGAALALGSALYAKNVKKNAAKEFKAQKEKEAEK